MQLQMEREEALIKEAQMGSIAAFEALVRQYDQQVMQLAFSLVNDVQDAQDIYQEVFVRVFRNLKRFQFRSQFSTWLYRVVVNYCINFNKKKQRAKFFSLTDENQNGEASWSVTLKGAEISPEDSMLNQELSVKIDHAIAQLSPKQKTVFVLRHYQGLKLLEIAKILKCSEGTVKNYLFRATQKMQSLLKEYSKI
jgi:RNA polymerase sigma-70 factor (ECF subfamily)